MKQKANAYENAYLKLEKTFLRNEMTSLSHRNAPLLK